MAKRTTIIRYGEHTIPEWTRELIETSFAIEAEDARKSGQLGFMTRALVSATMPYKDPKSKEFERKNGELTLSMFSPHGVPFGRYPRLIMSWMVTEAVRTQSPVISLGDTLAMFLREAVGVQATGGTQGTQTRITMQMQKLFTSLVSIERNTNNKNDDFSVSNILMVQRAKITAEDRDRFDNLDAIEDKPQKNQLWLQKDSTDIAKWNSHLQLTDEFYKECIETPVPLDMRAYRVLSPAPMAMDIYAWLTYRASYLSKPTRPIPWMALKAQFGSGYPFTEQGLRDFRKSFRKNLDLVRIVYPNLKVDETNNASGVVLMPMLPHVPKLKQEALF